MTHFLDEGGNIAKEMHKKSREIASFLALIIDTATKDYESSIQTTEIRCLKKKCTGTIGVGIKHDTGIIECWCTDCNEAGVISDWQKTKWDNRT